MSAVRRNLVANYASQAVNALVGVVFVPVYIRWLGIEAFSLVALFLTVQAVATLFDFGLAATLNRDLARAPNAAQGRDLLRTMEAVYWPVGALLGIVLALAAPWIARDWLHTVHLGEAATTQALRLMALALALQWPSLLYLAGLNGLQRQIRANGVTVLFTTLRGAGVLAPLWLLRADLEVYFAWMALCALGQTVVSGAMLHHALGGVGGGAPAARVRWPLLRAGLGFSSDLAVIGVLSFVLLQADRIVLSRLRPLDEFGVYALAATAAVMLTRVALPWYTAVLPRLAQLHARGDESALSGVYHRAAAWSAVSIVPIGTVLALWGEPLLAFWCRDAALAHAAAPIFSILVVGYALNGLATLPYALQLAGGWSRLPLLVNIGAVAAFLPAIVLLNDHLGLWGAALAWPMVNLGYLFVSVPVQHRRLLRGQWWRWASTDVGPAILVAAAGALAAALLPRPDADLRGILLLALAYAALMLCTVFATPIARADARAVLGRVLGMAGGAAR